MKSKSSISSQLHSNQFPSSEAVGQFEGDCNLPFRESRVFLVTWEFEHRGQYLQHHKVKQRTVITRPSTGGLSRASEQVSG